MDANMFMTSLRRQRSVDSASSLNDKQNSSTDSVCSNPDGLHDSIMAGSGTPTGCSPRAAQNGNSQRDYGMIQKVLVKMHMR
eukprot:Nk52_evm64s32 gene=Nk52_evmTU64s32